MYFGKKLLGLTFYDVFSSWNGQINCAINQPQANVLFLYPLKESENLWYIEEILV